MQAGARAAATLAGFRLLREIGRGAFSTVYLAEQSSSGQLVALKVVPLPAGPGLANASSQFLAAVRTASTLQHPHIVAIYDAGIDNTHAWLSMEAVPGTDLVRYTRPPRLLPEGLVLRLCARLAAALAHAHQQGLVHRDLKPANVLVNWAGDAVKLADFGLARARDAAHTDTGIVMGTPSYMAPEQLAGAVPSASSDIYALGVMLFELLTGQLPHQAQNMGELLRQVAQLSAPDLRSLRPLAPPELADLLAGMLHKSPARRPGDASVLATRLSALSLASPLAGAMSR